MNTRYYEMLNEEVQNKLPQTLMRRRWVNIMIERILSAKRILEAEELSNLSKIVRESLERYDVVYTPSSEEKVPNLVLKGTNPDELPKIVVPLEESFDIVFRAHLLTRHGGCNAMEKWLSAKNYVVNKKCLSVLISACQKCLLDVDDSADAITVEATDNTETETAPKIFSEVASLGLINFIDLSSNPDKSFCYLLIYQDAETKFVQLRPMTKTNLIGEVFMELIKLFSDFPHPECVVVPTKLKEAFGEILEKLNFIFKTKISIRFCDISASSVTAEVETEVTDWISCNEYPSWTIGCHMVQWKMNNTRCGDGMSPFEKVFPVGRRIHGLFEENTTITRKALQEIDPKGVEKDSKHVIENATQDAGIKIETDREEPDEDMKEKEIHTCCTCETVMTTKIYTCSICQRSLHLYCGTRTRGPNNAIQNTCYLCLK